MITVKIKKIDDSLECYVWKTIGVFDEYINAYLFRDACKNYYETDDIVIITDRTIVYD